MALILTSITFLQQRFKTLLKQIQKDVMFRITGIITQNIECLVIDLSIYKYERKLRGAEDGIYYSDSDKENSYYEHDV